MKSIFIILLITRLIIEGKKINLKEDAPASSRDYRPSKWVTNSALDIWYGNKSMVDVLSREFKDIMYKIAMRPGKLDLNSLFNLYYSRIFEIKVNNPQISYR